MNLEEKISGKRLRMVIDPSLVLKANSVHLISAYYAFCKLRKSAFSTVMKSKSAFSTVYIYIVYFLVSTNCKTSHITIWWVDLSKYLSDGQLRTDWLFSSE